MICVRYMNTLVCACRLRQRDKAMQTNYTWRHVHVPCIYTWLYNTHVYSRLDMCIQTPYLHKHVHVHTYMYMYMYMYMYLNMYTYALYSTWQYVYVIVVVSFVQQLGPLAPTKHLVKTYSESFLWQGIYCTCTLDLHVHVQVYMYSRPTCTCTGVHVV